MATEIRQLLAHRVQETEIVRHSVKIPASVADDKPFVAAVKAVGHLVAANELRYRQHGKRTEVAPVLRDAGRLIRTGSSAVFRNARGRCPY